VTPPWPKIKKKGRLLEVVFQRLRAWRIEPPTPPQVERLIRAAQHRYETALFSRVFEQPPTATRRALDNLLQAREPEVGQSAPRLPLQQLKAELGAVGLKSVLQAVTQLELLQQLHLPTDLFGSVSSQVTKSALCLLSPKPSLDEIRPILLKLNTFLVVVLRSFPTAL
jgi:hypothetical protein